MYYYIEPDVPGGIGKGSKVDSSTHPPTVSELHFYFDGWSGDDLVTTFPCYAITERFKNQLSESNFTGFEIDSLKISKSEIFNEIFPGRNLPNFYWLKINGKCGYDDLGIAKDHRLVISEKVKKILDKLSIKEAEIEIFNDQG